MALSKHFVLGHLEMAVLDRLWSAGPQDAKNVHQVVGTERGISLNTVQSTMERLYRKDLLSRQKVSHAYVYKPDVERNRLIGRMIDDVLHSFAAKEDESLLMAFVDHAAETDEHSLDILEKLIARKKAEINKKDK